MSLGLETEITGADILTGLAIIASLGLSVELARKAEAKMLEKKDRGMTGGQRGMIWCCLSLILGVAWWLTFDRKYFPQTEVVTAVIPALHHPWQSPWAAPYGLLWYILNIPVWRLGQAVFGWLVPSGIDWMLTLLLGNLLFLWMFRKSELLASYFMTSMFLWFVVPWNLSILWLVSLGFRGSSLQRRIGAVMLGVIAKLPVGAPLSVWKYDFLNGQEGGTVGSAFVPGHLMPYAVLGAWCLAVLVKPYIRYFGLNSYYLGEVNSRVAEGSSKVAGEAEGTDGTYSFEGRVKRARSKD